MWDNIFYENLLLVPTITFFVTVLVKWIAVRVKTWKIDLIRSFWSGWMPSVHSSVVVSLTTAIWMSKWVQSEVFAMALAFTMIIIYDAINVRFEAGLHASAINQHLWEKKFKESLGHLPSEAFAGSILWIFIAFVLFFV